MTNKKITVNGKNENNNTKINQISKCISCSHKEVCKYKEEFEKFMEEIKNKNIKIPKMFDLDITCSKYFAHYRTIDSTPQIMPLSTPEIILQVLLQVLLHLTLMMVIFQKLLVN